MIRALNCRFAGEPTRSPIYTYLCDIDEIQRGDYAIVSVSDDPEYPLFKVVQVISQRTNKTLGTTRRPAGEFKFLLQRVDKEKIDESHVIRQRTKEIHKALTLRLNKARRDLAMKELLNHDPDAKKLMDELRLLENGTLPPEDVGTTDDPLEREWDHTYSSGLGPEY